VFIDGALSGYNNPSSLLLNEGLDLAREGQQIDVLLSLGCGEVYPEPKP
jgi:alcohol dehydrogenase YqhD (iron-dependent ADH family)